MDQNNISTCKLEKSSLMRKRNLEIDVNEANRNLYYQNPHKKYRKSLKNPNKNGESDRNILVEVN